MNFDFKRHLLPLCAAISVLVLIMWFFWPTLSLIHIGKSSAVQQLDMELHVSDKPNEVGFDTGLDKLKFGWIAPGGSSEKGINVVNKGTAAQVVIKTDGDFKDWLDIQNTSFKLAANEAIEIPVIARVPFDATPGDYNGTLKVYFYR